MNKTKALTEKVARVTYNEHEDSYDIEVWSGLEWLLEKRHKFVAEMDGEPTDVSFVHYACVIDILRLLENGFRFEPFLKC